MTRIGLALLEFEELLASRGETALAVQADYAVDRIRIIASWPGPALPPAARQPSAMDLEGDSTVQQSFALWLVGRSAETMEQRPRPDGSELRLSFID